MIRDFPVVEFKTTKLQEIAGRRLRIMDPRARLPPLNHADPCSLEVQHHAGAASPPAKDLPSPTAATRAVVVSGPTFELLQPLTAPIAAIDARDVPFPTLPFRLISKRFSVTHGARFRKGAGSSHPVTPKGTAGRTAQKQNSARPWQGKNQTIEIWKACTPLSHAYL